MKKLGKNYIVFDNLVQADSNVVGKNQAVKAEEKPNGKMYAQENSHGKLYQPADLNEVSVRAKEAGKRFLSLLENTKSQIDPTTHHQAEPLTWRQLLLVKFPTFDPSWSEEVKAKWFHIFDWLIT